MYELQSPNSKITVRPGNIVKLNRFDDECWIVNLGWFSYAGNRPINGWYLVSKAYKDKVKPLNLSDLEDIYVIEAGEVKEDYKELDPEIKKLIHDLKVQVEELSREVAQLTAEVEAKDEVIAEKGEEILELQRQIRELQRQIEELESQHRLDAETIATLNSQVTAQAQIIAEKAAEIRELTARVAELAEENELLTQQHQEDLATIAQQASTIQAQAESIASLTDDNNRLTDENDRLTEENTELVAQHQEDTATITEQQETISSQGEQITELSGEVDALTVENTRLEALTETQRETIQNMLDNPPQPQLYTPPVVTPSGSVQQISPPTGYDGLTNTVVDRVSAAVDPDIMPENIREGVDILGVEGTYNPFPEHSYGGIYYTELGEGGYPKKILIKDMLRSASTIPRFFNTSNDAKRELREVVFENCPEFFYTQADIFNGFSYLIKAVLPNSLKGIGNNTFYNCSSLQTINIPSGVTSIEGSAFYNCSSLQTINIPSGVTSIGGYAFYGCSSLQTINIPSGVTSIEGNTFYNCSSLQTINLQSGVTSIGQQAFYDCYSLQTINLPSSLTSIANNAFRICSSLRNVTIENGFNCNGLNLSASTRFTAETIVSCLEALADRTGQAAYTITFGTTNLNKLTAEQKAIATNKNWNLA